MSANILSNPEGLTSSQNPAAPPKVELPIGGITPFTTIDFPGHLAAVLYTQGCAWRCRYCHNTHLRDFASEQVVSFARALHFLENRKGLLEGVVFCGGEPTSYADLPEALRQVRAMGFKTALHTTGMYPERLRAALAHCDWVGMDIKAPFRRYRSVTQIEHSGISSRLSADMLVHSGVDHEFRTTVHPDLLTEPDILEIAHSLKHLGARKYTLQIFQPKGCSDEALKQTAVMGPLISAELEKTLTLMFDEFHIRG